MTGHSSGGFMSFSFATTHASKVAAIARGRAGGGTAPSPPAGRPLDPRHGRRRRTGRTLGTPSAPSPLSLAQHNGCGPVERTELRRAGPLRSMDGRPRETEVVFTASRAATTAGRRGARARSRRPRIGSSSRPTAEGGGAEEEKGDEVVRAGGQGRGRRPPAGRQRSDRGVSAGRLVAAEDIAGPPDSCLTLGNPDGRIARSRRGRGSRLGTRSATSQRSETPLPRVVPIEAPV